MAAVDDLIEAFSNKVPPQFKALALEYREFLRESLQSLLRAQGLVTREEFDIQCQVLQRTREKLKDLEAQVKALQG